MRRQEVRTNRPRLLLSFVLVVALYGLSVARPVQWFKITSGSMEPVLNVGDYVVGKSTKFEPAFRGDIVVFDIVPGMTKIDDFLVKRLAAVSGDTVEIVSGVLYVNGVKEVDNVYRDNSHLSKRIVPNGMVFVLGCNRLKSSDSRDYGFVDINSIHYKVVKILPHSKPKLAKSN